MKKISWLILLIIFSLALRFGYLWESYQNNPAFFHPLIDSARYHNAAINMLLGKPIGYQAAFQPVFYPLFLSYIYHIFGVNVLIVKIIQHLLGVLTVFLTFLIGKKLINFRGGLISAFIVAAYGPLIIYEGELLATSLAAFIFIAIVLFLYRPFPKSNYLRVLLTGCCLEIGRAHV